MPQKRYIVRLTAQEREVCQQTVRKLNGSSEKVRRAQILLKADADGPAWTDQRVAEAFSCRMFGVKYFCRSTSTILAGSDGCSFDDAPFGGRCCGF